MRRFYVGDGQFGFWRWIYANARIGRLWLWTLIPHRFAPPLPDGWAWNVRKDQDAKFRAGLYARHDS